MNSEEFIAHYGREGMKWYQHIFGKFQEHAKYNKEKRALKKGEKKQKKEEQKDLSNKIKQTLKKNNYKKLSNEELKNRIERMKVEKEYLDLAKDTRTKGKKFIDGIAELSTDILKGSVKNIGQQYVSYWLGVAINKKAGQDIVNPKKGQKDK